MIQCNDLHEVVALQMLEAMLDMIVGSHNPTTLPETEIFPFLVLKPGWQGWRY
jgi:hypothetical protein